MKRVRKILYGLLVLGFCWDCCGCYVMSHLDALIVLNGYSKEKDSQQRAVNAIRHRYDALLQAIADRSVLLYSDKTAWVRAFGDPLLKKTLHANVERWLYRYAIERYAKDKVYVYFDVKGRVLRWERLPCS